MRLTRTAAGGLAMLVVALPGCGGGGEDSTGARETSRQEAAQRFAQCMRQNGVSNMPDPDERGMFEITPESDEVPAATRERAQRACERHLRAAGPPEPLSDEQQAEQLDRLTRFNRCMRENGVDLPAPDVNDRGAAQDLGDEVVDTPRFERAHERCESTLRDAGGGR
jgi:hypothetical protein